MMWTKRAGSSVPDLNFRTEVTAGRALPRGVVIEDDTLREGEQAAGVYFSSDEKVRIAEKLEEAGIRRIVVGRADSEEDRAVIRRLRANGSELELQTQMALRHDNWQEQMVGVSDAGIDLLSLTHTSSDRRFELAGISREYVLELVVEATRFAKERSPRVRFSATDTTYADLDFLKQLMTAAVDAGVDEIAINDTSGTTLPQAMAYLVREIVATVDVPVRVHCHNDFGLGLATTLAAFEAGATVLNGAINGIGERSGCVSIDEIVVAVELLYGIDTGVDTTRLCELSRLVSEITGVPVAKNKPIVGGHAFAHKANSHVMRLMTNPSHYEMVDPAWVGNESVVLLDRGSGPHSVLFNLRRLGLEASDAHVTQLVHAVNRSATKERQPVSDENFRLLVQQTVNS